MDAEKMTSAAVSASHPLRLYKKEKLCSAIAIGQLFAAPVRGTAGPDDPHAVHSALAYPLRMVWRVSPGRKSDAPVQFLISIPKKRLRHAVDRVMMRRRVREAYRLRRPSLMLPDGVRLDVAFLYIGNGLEPYSRVEKAVDRLLCSFRF